MKKLLAGLVLCILLVGLLAVVLGPAIYKSLIETELLDRLNTGTQVKVHTQGLATRGLALSADKLTVLLTAALLRFELSDLALRPSYLSLPALRPELRFSAKVYGGDLSGYLSYRIRNAEFLADLSIDGLDLAAHPELNALGLKNGSLTLNTAASMVQAQRLTGMRGSLRLSDLSFPSPQSLPGRLFGLNKSIFIPAVKHMSAGADFSFGGSLLDLSSLSVHSSFGKLAGSGSFRFSDGYRLEEVNFKATATLNEQGDALLRLIGEASQAEINTPPAGIEPVPGRWSIILRGKPPLRAVLRPLPVN